MSHTYIKYKWVELHTLSHEHILYGDYAILSMFPKVFMIRPYIYFSSNFKHMLNDEFKN